MKKFDIPGEHIIDVNMITVHGLTAQGSDQRYFTNRVDAITASRPSGSSISDRQVMQIRLKPEHPYVITYRNVEIKVHTLFIMNNQPVDVNDTYASIVKNDVSDMTAELIAKCGEDLLKRAFTAMGFCNYNAIDSAVSCKMMNDIMGNFMKEIISDAKPI